MSTSSESADEFVKITLEGTEMIARLSGSLAKNFIAMVYAISKDKSKNPKGKTSLNKLLKSNSKLEIFTIRKEDLEDFKKQAKTYKITYTALYNKNERSSDGMVDLIIKEEDAPRVNRLVERYNITKVDIQAVEKELNETSNIKQEELPQIEENQEILQHNTSDDLISSLLSPKEDMFEEMEDSTPSNITEKEIQLENILNKNEETKIIDEKPSIREKIEVYKNQIEDKKEVKIQEEIKDNPKKNEIRETKHKQPKKRYKKKRREKIK